MPFENKYGQILGDAMSHWQIRPEPQRVTLIGRTCRLEPVDVAKHSEELFEAYSQSTDNRDWTYLMVDQFNNLQECRNYIEKAMKCRDMITFAVIDGSGKAVGMIALLRIDTVNGAIEVGRVMFSPLLKQSTPSTEAQYLLMTYVFDDLGYRRYEWKCDSFNTPSRRAAERLGFTFEGIFRNAVIVNGHTRDRAWYSIIDSEWPKIKKAFFKWLAPENFDDNGHQIKKLTEFREDL